MTLFIVSFIAGILTVLAPCILPLLPVILGGAVAEAGNKRRPFIIIGSLSISVFLFTLLLKGSTALITVSPSFWSYVSALIFIAFGLTLLFPETWARIVLKIPGHNKPDRWITKGYGTGGSFWTDVIVGAALGPVFTTCSPTFFVILATVLPQSLSMGIVDLWAYIIGLALSLLLISFIGQKLVDRLEWASDPKGWFKKALGVLFIILALAIAFGWDKEVEADILHSGFFDVTNVEQSIHQYLANPSSSNSNSDVNLNQSPVAIPSNSPNSNNSVANVIPNPPGVPTHDEGPYIEIVNPAGFINSPKGNAEGSSTGPADAPFTLSQFIGKKVVLVDFVDYSCINCERTFPYLNDWYSKYKDQGLEIVAIHTPEFSFEKDIANVTAAAKQFGLQFPIVLDNDYSTWNAYGNEYWPHKYLIDIHGRVIYDHIGEGGYDETEAEIVQALNQRAQYLGLTASITEGSSTVPAYNIQAQSPETYFGAMRNEFFGNGLPSIIHTGTFSIPDQLSPNEFYLGGQWDIQNEYIQNLEAGAQISYVFNASKMYIIAVPSTNSSGSPMIITAQILIDGKPITSAQSGTDVKNGILTITSSRLYNIFSDTVAGQHRVDVIFQQSGAEAFTFTFG